MKKYISGYIILILIVATACEKTLDYQITSQEPNVVMYAFPMPDSTLNIHASLSTDILSSDNYMDIEGMQYVISENDAVKVSDTYPYNKKWHSISLIQGSAGQKISITYNLQDGSTATGETIIPNAVEISNIDTISTEYTSQEGEEEEMLRCTLEINDPATQKNYYQIRVDHVGTDSSGSIYQETIDYIKEDKGFLIRDDESVLLTEVDFQGTFTDYLFDGDTYSIKLLIPNQYLAGSTDTTTNRLDIYLFSLTPEYYKYIRSLIEEEAFRDYPIFEPINIYSNITGGVGVVAGLSVDTVSILLPYGD